MKNLLLASAALAALFCLRPAEARAQDIYTASSCGTQNIPVGFGGNLIVTSTGLLCTSSGGGSGSNAAAGTTGVAPPGSASYTGFQNAGGNLVGVSPSNPLPITGSISASFSQFAPISPAVSLTATSTSSNALLTTGGTTLSIYNGGSTTVSANLGTSNAVTASATSPIVIPAGTTVGVGLGANTYLAVYASSGSDTVTATSGIGGVSGYGGGGGGASLTNYALETGGNLASIVSNTNNLMKATGGTIQLVAGSAAIGSITNTSFGVTQSTASALNATVVGLGTAGTPLGGVVTIQGISGGTAIPVAGSFTASAPADSIPASPTLSGATYSAGALTFTANGQTAVFDTNGQRLSFSVTTSATATIAAYTSETPSGSFSSFGSAEFVCTNSVGAATSSLTYQPLVGQDCYIGGAAGRYVELITTAYTGSPTLNVMLRATPVSSKQVFVANTTGVSLNLAGSSAASAASAGSTGTTTLAVHQVPNSGPAVAITPTSTTAVASSQILKASAGNGYRYAMTAGASAGYFMIFDATTAPADGTVTPKICRAVAANQSIEIDHADAPDRFSTGIVEVFSTTGCYTKTASATASFEGNVE